jgi:DNA ligase (NAD+)
MSCPAIVKQSIRHFAGKSALDIDGLGTKIIDQLVEKSLVKTVADIYRLTKEDIIGLERLADKSAENLLGAIERSKQTTLTRLIYALGIRHVGEHVAGVLAEEYASIEVLEDAGQEELTSIREIGPKVAESIHTFFRGKTNRDVISDLLRQGVSYTRAAPAGPGRLAGKVFVFTGGLEDFTRDEAKRLVESLGGRVVSGVSKKVDYVVVGTDAGTKLSQAKKLGITILDEKEFKQTTSA